MNMWPRWLITPQDVVNFTADNPHRALFYLSVGGWLGLIIYNLHI